jgi:hypothetical protein
MAITFTLVSQGSNHLVYLASSSGGAQGEDDIGIIQNRAPATGGANVDLAAASVPPAGVPYNAGLLKELVDIEYTIASPVDLAHRQLLDWGLGSAGGIVSVPGKRLRATVEQVCPSDSPVEVLKSWGIDARSDGEATSYGEYVVTCSEVGAARALVRIEAIGTPQQF